MNRSSALKIAERLMSLLQPLCMRIDVAGSLRREKPEVGDIEIVCEPKKISTPNGAQLLFEEYGTLANLVVTEDWKNTVRLLGKIIKGKPDGRMMQIELPESIMLDLFMPRPEDYYRQLAIRTGSATFSHQVIAAGWKRIGWCGTGDGLRKMSECLETKTPDKSTWKCCVATPTLPPVWESEIDFFKWINVTFIEPKYREI